MTKTLLEVDGSVRVTDSNSDGCVVCLEADILLAISTVPGYPAWRDITLGTWFIQEFVRVISESAHEEHMEEMLIKVGDSFRHLM